MYLMNCFYTDICWLRLDFETFTNQGLSATDEGGAGSAASPTCTDTFTVTTGTAGTSQSSIYPSYPVICGDNTGQHSKVFHCKLKKHFVLALNFEKKG